MPHIPGSPKQGHEEDRQGPFPLVDVGEGIDLGAPPAPPAGGRAERFPALQQELGIGDLRVGEVPLAEAELNLRRRQDAERRRGQGLGALQGALNEIGTTEGEIAAREVALERLRGGGRGAGALRGQLAASQESALRAMSDQFAQRGVGGGVPALGLAQAQRTGAIQAAGTEAAFRENLQRSALQDIEGMNQAIGQRRLAAQDLLQRYLGEWELPPMDFSGMAIVPEDRTQLVGGSLPGQPGAGDGEAVDFGEPNTWEQGGNLNMGRVPPDGHEFAGCVYYPGNINDPPRYVCPEGNFRADERRGG